MTNISIISGRIVRDPELKMTQGGLSICNFTVAVNRRSKDGKDEADFIPVVCFSKVAEIIAEKTEKGGRVIVEGSIKTGKYEHKDGHTVYTTEINAYKVDIIDWRKDSNQGFKKDVSFDDMTPIANDSSIPF